MDYPAQRRCRVSGARLSMKKVGQSLLSRLLLPWGFCVGIFLAPLGASAVPRHEVIVLTGHTGESAFEAPIREAAQRWTETAKRAGHSTVWIGEKKTESQTGDAPVALEEFKNRIQAVEARSLEPVWIVLIGHGNAQGRSPKFALEGPDLSAEDLAKWLERLERPVVVVAGFAGSGAFVKPLAGKSRIIVAGTRSGDEENWVRFSGYFAQAISGSEADWDGDGQVSVFEAWIHAAHAVDRFYKESGRMVTEHAVLEDSGDGRAVGRELFEPPASSGSAKNKGAPAPPKLTDGSMARQWSLVISAVEGALFPEERLKRQELEARLLELRSVKAQRPVEEYWRDVEAVLLELETVYRAAKGRLPAEAPVVPR